MVDTLERDVLVVFEATSGCDADHIAALAERSYPFSRVNPHQAREPARATGVLTKIDRVDARVLARMGPAQLFGLIIALLSQRDRSPPILAVGRTDQTGLMWTPPKRRVSSASPIAG